MPYFAYLGNLEHGLGDVDNGAHLLDVLDAGLDGLGVVGTGGVEDALDLLGLALSPLLVGGATVLDESTPGGQEAEGDDGLLVHDVVLAGEGIDAEASAGGEDGRLAHEAVAGEGVEDALGLLLGVLGGHIAARVAGRGGGGQSRESSAGDGRSEERSSACSRRGRRGRLVSYAANWARKSWCAIGLTYRQRFAPSGRPL